MKRQPPPKAAAGIQLFPFLAVLLCTMGSLLLLLVVISRHSRDQAAKNIRTDSQAYAELDERRAALEWRREQLLLSRGKTRQQLTDYRSELSHLEEHARRVRAEMERAEHQADDLKRTDALDDQAKQKLRDKFKSYEEEAKALKEEIEKAKRDARMRPNTFAIVPGEIFLARGHELLFRRGRFVLERKVDVVGQHRPRRLRGFASLTTVQTMEQG